MMLTFAVQTPYSVPRIKGEHADSDGENECQNRFRYLGRRYVGLYFKEFHKYDLTIQNFDKVDAGSWLFST